MTRSLVAAMIFGFGGSIALVILFDLTRADGRSFAEELFLFGWLAAIHAAMGAAGGWAVTAGTTEKGRTASASAGFAVGFLLPGVCWYLSSKRYGAAAELIVPLSYVGAALIGMLFVNPRRALYAAGAVAALIAAVIPIGAALDHLESIGYSGAPFIGLLFFLTYLIPFVGTGAVLGFLAEPTEEDNAPRPGAGDGG